MNATLVAARAVHFASAILLFGELAFILVVARPAPRGAGRVASDPDIYRRYVWIGSWSVVASIVSGLIWLAAEAAIMSGTPLPQAISLDTLGLVLGETVFGRLWVLRFGLAVALGALLLATARSDDDGHKLRIAMGALVVATAYLAALAWAGHAAAGPEPQRDIQLFSDVIHLLAAGAWLGALPGLVWWLGRAQPLDAAAQATRRFSTLGAISVSALATTGLINAWYLVGNVPALFGTEYGRLLLAKLALFAAMLVIAAANRWYLTPRVAGHDHRSLNLLRRNAILEIAAGSVVVTIVGALGVSIPGAHQPPLWPFDHTLSWQPAERSAWVGAIVAATITLACVAAGVTLEGARRRRPRLLIAGLACVAATTAISAWLLAVPAYPTTYLASPVPYTTDSIIRGAMLYDRSCSACHGAHGHGDGPAAASLPIKPSDLAEHATLHHPGDLFWWIAHGVPGTPMPGFATRLSDSEIWDLVQFLRAQAHAQQAVTLTGRAEPRLAAEAPDFTFEIAGEAQASLRQRAANGVTLLVFYVLPESLPRLQALARAEPVFAAARARIVAVPRGKSSSFTTTVLPRESIFATTGPSVETVYAMFARQSRDRGDNGSEHAEFLIDARGYLRARWIGVPAATIDRTAEILSQIKLLNDERLRAYTSEDHAH
jgi:putative copper export protein/mono/diheme cytochrome c family protein